jgi:hypothetical protein
MSESNKDGSAKARGKPPEEVVNAILEALSGMRYGQVTIIVQDGHVIQIDRVEKRRLKNGS